jgi:hypothetical protein
MRSWGRFWRGGALVIGAMSCLACGSGPRGKIKVADAEFNPATAADIYKPLSELSPAVAQTFVVGQDGLLEEFQLVLTDGNSADDGTIRVLVQPAPGGVIDDNPNASLITPIVVDTSTLPLMGEESLTIFDISDRPGRDVVAGDELALVVEFVGRTTSTDTNPIARVVGQSGDPYPDGTGATGELNVGFTNNTDDYFFRTFLLVPTSN